MSHSHCANCQAELAGPFCSQCGQHAHESRRPFFAIVQELIDAVFGADSRSFRTLGFLVAKPGELTRWYMAGRRVSLLPPFRLYLLATFLFFLTVYFSGITLMALEVVQIDRGSTPPWLMDATDQQPERPESEAQWMVVMRALEPTSSLTVRELPETVRQELDSQAADETTPGYLRGMARGIERAMSDPTRLNGPLNAWLPRAFFVLMPLYGALLWLFYFRKKHFYVEHLVFSLHLHTVAFVALTLMVALAALEVDGGIIMIGGLAAMAVYAWIAMKRYYRQGIAWTTVKFAAVSGLYFVLLAASLIVVTGLALMET